MHTSLANTDSTLLCTVAGKRHSLGWLNDTQLAWIVYQHDDPAGQNYFVNYANEAYAFLLFMHQFYDCLPKVRSFVADHHSYATEVYTLTAAQTTDNRHAFADACRLSPFCMVI